MIIGKNLVLLKLLFRASLQYYLLHKTADTSLGEQIEGGPVTRGSVERGIFLALLSVRDELKTLHPPDYSLTYDRETGIATLQWNAGKWVSAGIEEFALSCKEE